MKDKILNILLFVSIFLLVMSFFSPKKDVEVSPVVSIVTQKSYTVPAGVKIDIKNQTQSGFTFNTCSDLHIKKDSRMIMPQDCTDITVKAGESYQVDLSNEFSKFYDTGSYFVNLKSGEVDVLTQFEVEHRGFFGKVFIFFFYAPIYNLMAFLLEITHYSLGWAIILITILIRIILLVPQHKMMVSQMKMQKIQPKIKEIQEKYKGNHQVLGVELMKLYKEEGVNPMGSCGLLLIQMPILLVIYNVIVGIQNTSNTYYLYSFLSDYDMSSISANFYGLDLFGIGGIPGLILAIIVAGLQYLQVKLSLYYTAQKNKNTVVLEKKKDASEYSSFMPDPDMMNKFMLYGMPVMIFFATYTFFAGLGIYWGIGTLFMIFQQLFVNKILKK